MEPAKMDGTLPGDHGNKRGGDPPMRVTRGETGKTTARGPRPKARRTNRGFNNRTWRVIRCRGDHHTHTLWLWNKKIAIMEKHMQGICCSPNLPVPFVDRDVENNKWVKTVTYIGLQGRGNTSGTRVMIFQKPTSTDFLWGAQAVPIRNDDFGCRVLHFMKRNKTRAQTKKNNYTILMLVKGGRKQHGKL